MRTIKRFLAIVLGIVSLFILWVWPIVDSNNHGNPLPLFTVIGVFIGFALWAFMKNQDNKREKEKKKRGEERFWGKDIY